jgi:hypothetical protein
MALGVSLSEIPNSSRLSQNLYGDLVLDAFLLHSLLRDADVRGEQLSLPHGGLQRHRFYIALDQRNYRMAGTGQEMWAHACNKCMVFYRGPDEAICGFILNSVATLCSYNSHQIMLLLVLLMG